MAYTVERIGFDVQPYDNDDGTLKGVRLSRELRIERKSDDGRVLDRGWPEAQASIDIPAERVEDVIKELVSWMCYYATGEAAKDSRDPVSWPNSVSTVVRP
ncbi:MAG TPA: hypothetical protein VHL57_03790 [Flavobacteriales bacterium]|jgi:hypothetical protein|nr:hypothetical protein [Flavobacteriales bacterium]